jgi:hypothetical protein
MDKKCIVVCKFAEENSRKIKFSSKYENKKKKTKCSIKKAQQKPFLATAAFCLQFSVQMLQFPILSILKS